MQKKRPPNRPPNSSRKVVRKMSTLVFLSLGCLFEAIAAPIESAINKPRPKVYRKRPCI